MTIGNDFGGSDYGGSNCGGSDNGSPGSPARGPGDHAIGDGARLQAAAISLPPLPGSLPHSTSQGHTLRVEGTNVVRVPFGVRQPRRQRPSRPERWATVVLPFQAAGPTPPPPQAA